MRTLQTTISFGAAFSLTGESGELPAGTYEVELDEVEIVTPSFRGYRRVGAILYVQAGGSVRSIAVSRTQLEAAMLKDRLACEQRGDGGPA